MTITLWGKICLQEKDEVKNNCMDGLPLVSPVHVSQRGLLQYPNAQTHPYALGNDSRHTMKSSKAVRTVIMCVSLLTLLPSDDLEWYCFAIVISYQNNKPEKH